jgi:hypothetical protein
MLRLMETGVWSNGNACSRIKAQPFAWSSHNTHARVLEIRALVGEASGGRGPTIIARERQEEDLKSKRMVALTIKPQLSGVCGSFLGLPLSRRPAFF